MSTQNGPVITGIHHIPHTGIRSRPNRTYATVVFRDPDNSQLEFAAPISRDAA